MSQFTGFMPNRGTKMSQHDWWEQIPLRDMSDQQWESLCDRCGKCCLNRLVNDEGEYFYTTVVCPLMDLKSGCCTQYANRTRLKPSCWKVTPDNIQEISEWMPSTCAYRLVYEGKPLPSWHPLRNDGRVSLAVHQQLRGRLVSEDAVKNRPLEAFILDDEPITD